MVKRAGGKKKGNYPGRKPGSKNKRYKDPTLCICGRNLLYALRETALTVTCRCGRIHKKIDVLKGLE